MSGNWGDQGIAGTEARPTEQAGLWPSGVRRRARRSAVDKSGSHFWPLGRFRLGWPTGHTNPKGNRCDRSRYPRSRFLMLRFMRFALKGPNNSAQGNALGRGTETNLKP
jgi:hypothetical protein